LDDIVVILANPIKASPVQRRSDPVQIATLLRAIKGEAPIVAAIVALMRREAGLDQA
jgi:hypothetical protein